MASESTFVCPLPNGVHARPASALEEVARRFRSEITIINERTGYTANAKSVLSLVGADIKHQDACRIVVTGGDEHQAFMAMEAFIRDDFPGCDEPLPEVAARGPVLLPRPLRQEQVTYYSGTAVAGGMGQGRGVAIDCVWSSEAIKQLPVLSAAQEWSRWEKALPAVEIQFQNQLRQSRSLTEAKVLEAHISILRDPEFHRLIELKIKNHAHSAAGALAVAVQHFSEVLKATGSTLLRERILDIQDVAAQLVREIYGEAMFNARIALVGPSIVVADNLTPSQFLGLDRTCLQGLVLTQGGQTSHTIILARSFGVPTLTDVAEASSVTLADKSLILDARRGLLIVDPAASVERFYQRERETLRLRREALASFARQPAQTRDGRRLEVAANVATAVEVASAVAQGAEAVGLFRTEMLFLDRPQPPTEEDQYKIYLEAVTGAAGRPVIFRTLDVGGDKPLAYLNIPAEANPFLGYRAVRMYPEFVELFRTQLRAMLRASAHGPAKLMIPMVCCLEEIHWVKAVLAEVRRQLDEQRLAYDPALPLGIMVEIPATAMILDQLAEEVDFFSIGTNDLTQYFLAVDRENPKVASLYSPLHPSFLRLLQMIVTEARRLNKWVGMCGEMAGDISALPLLIGLGLNEISLGGPAIPAIKAAISQRDFASCQELLRSALACKSQDEVRRLLNDFQETAVEQPLIAAELIHFAGDIHSKEEAIKAAVDSLYVCGRTEDPQAVEEAVWQREEVYSTGLGFGLAIPHCKSDAMRTNAMSILRLEKPIAWNSLDGQPVEIVILLAIRQSDKNDTHMRLFAKLARKIMHEEFRQQLLTAANPEALLTCLAEALSLSPKG